MTNEAWNKVVQTHDTFKKIVAPLKEHLGIDFGYMIVFNDGRYFQIIENLECLHKWVANIETSSIFCARNVTTYFDDPYNFTIWPETPTTPAMEIYKEYGMWNGITVSRVSEDYAELYWFTKQNAEDGWHRWFIRNKEILLKFIKYFRNYTKILGDKKLNPKQELFIFTNEFYTTLLESEYASEESLCINKFASCLSLDPTILHSIQTKTNLSLREIEVLSMICRGYTIKLVAQKLGISVKTAQCYINRVKDKSNIRYKTDLIQLYGLHFQ